MSPFEALFLAVLQGATEFLPVSSSGHLVVAGALFGLELDGAAQQAFFVLLHTASLVAVLAWFGRDLFRTLTGSEGKRMLVAILLGCLPAAVVGLALKASDNTALFDTPWLVGIAWIATALLLWTTRRTGTGGWKILDASEPLRAGALVLVGFAQAAALVPGISRSGATIAVALLAGMHREDTFRFSFFMAIPLILGAQVMDLSALAELRAAASVPSLAVGFATCFAISLACLALLEQAVVHRKLHWFAPYCLAAGLATLGVIALRGGS